MIKKDEKTNCHPLHNKTFTKLCIANLMTRLGDSLDNLVITLLAIQLTNSGSATGILLSIASIPGIVLSIVGGAVSDTIKKERVLIIITSIQGVLVLTLALITFTGKITFSTLCLFLFILECCSRFYTPAFISTVVNIVDNKQYSKAQSILTTSSSLVEMIGSAVFTSVITLFGYTIPFLINSGSYFISSLILRCTKFLKVESKVAQNKENIKLKEAVKEGFSYLKTQPFIMRLIIIVLVMNFCLALYDVGLPFLLSEQLNLPIEYLGYMKTISLFAFVIAGVVATKLSFSRPMLSSSIAIAVMGISVLIISFSTNFLYTSFIWGVAAFSRTIVAILISSNLAIAPDKIYVGRITGIVATFSSIGIFISRGVSGIIVDFMGANMIFLMSGIVFILMALSLMVDKNAVN